MFYFDTSFLTPLLRQELTTPGIEEFVAALPAGSLATCDLTRIEFTSVLARDVRMGGISEEAAKALDDRFQSRIGASFVILLPTRDDFDLARNYVRDHRTGLRAPDALHLAVARNNRAEMIYTLDKAMLKAGKRIGLPIGAGIRIPR